MCQQMTHGKIETLVAGYLLDKVPLVYHERYNIEFMGLEKQHPFDSTKYRNVFNALDIPASQILLPEMPDQDMLLLAHTHEYLASLEHSATMAKITEFDFLKLLPSSIIRPAVLEPMCIRQAAACLQQGLRWIMAGPLIWAAGFIMRRSIMVKVSAQLQILA